MKPLNLTPVPINLEVTLAAEDVPEFPREDSQPSASASSPQVSGRGSRVLEVARCDAPVATASVPVQAAAVEGSAEELQRLLEMSRKARETQQASEAQLEDLSIADVPATSSTSKTSGAPPRPKAKPPALRGAPQNSQKRAAVRRPSISIPGSAAGSRPVTPVGSRRPSKEIPRLSVSGLEMPRQPPVPQAVVLRPSQGPPGRPATPPSRHEFGPVLPRRASELSLGVRRTSKDFSGRPPALSNAAIASSSMSSVGLGSEPESEEYEDNSWQEEMLRGFGEQLRPISNKHKDAQRAAAALEQALRHLRLDRNKVGKILKTETEQVMSELKEVEQKSEARVKVLRAGAEKAEAALDTARSDLQEVQTVASAAAIREAGELEKLSALRDVQVKRNADIGASAHSAAGKAEAYEDSREKLESEAAAELSEAERLEEVIKEAEVAITDKIRSKFQLQTALVHEHAGSVGARCREMIDDIRHEHSCAEALEKNNQKTSAQLARAQAQNDGFRKAMQLSGEASLKQLRQDLCDLKAEETALTEQLETFTNRLAPENSMSVPSSSRHRGEHLKQTAQAACQDLEQHRAAVVQLFTDSSSQIAPSPMATAPIWSRGFGAEAGGNSCSSSARTAPDLPSSVRYVPEGSPITSVSVPGPSSPGSSASMRIYGSLAAGRRQPMSMASFGGFSSTPLKNGAWETASRRFEAGISSREAQLQSLTLAQSTERRALEGSARSAKGACDSALRSLRWAEMQRWAMEADFWRIRMERATWDEAQARVPDGSGSPLTFQMAAESEYVASEARLAAAESAFYDSEASETFAAAQEGPTMLPSTAAGQKLAPHSLIASVAKLEAELVEACKVEETLQRQHAEASEVCQLRMSETQALREVAAANVELRQWKGDLEASAQAMQFDPVAQGQLQELHSEIADEETALEVLQSRQCEADVQRRTWAGAMEAALQAEVEAAHVAHIEALVALDSRLDEEAALRAESERLVRSRESWESVVHSETLQQAALSETATKCTIEGNRLQEVYASRAQEVERLYSLHSETLSQQRDLQDSLLSTRSHLAVVESTLTEKRRREAEVAHAAKAELEEEKVLQAEWEATVQAVEAAGSRFSTFLQHYREQRRYCAEAIRAFGHSSEERRELLDSITDIREECAITWRGLDGDEAQHVVLSQQLDSHRQRQAAEASALATTAAADATKAMKRRFSDAAFEHTRASERCSRLRLELKEAEEGCNRLSRVLERGPCDQGPESTQDKVLREDNAAATAYLAKVQATSTAASEAVAQSAGAVGMAEEEASQLTALLLRARSECGERSRSLTVAAEAVEQSRSDYRFEESELRTLEQEACKLNQARQAVGFDVPAPASAQGEADLWAARERRTETLPREQMILLQHLRGSQRGGAGFCAGSGALEALRDLRERQLLQGSALAAEEDLRTAELQNSLKASVYEMGTSEQQLRLELESLHRDRESLLAKLRNGEEAWQSSEQHLRKQIQQLNGEPEAKETIDDDTIVRMGIVMREAEKYSVEQQLRLDAAELERDEVRKRLLDTLGHLEGPEYAELVVAAAVRAAANQGTLEEGLPQVAAEGALPGTVLAEPWGMSIAEEAEPMRLP